jgi:hypothetical protein
MKAHLKSPFDLDVVYRLLDSFHHMPSAQKLFAELHQVGHIELAISYVFLQLERYQSDCL